MSNIETTTPIEGEGIWRAQLARGGMPYIHDRHLVLGRSCSAVILRGDVLETV